MSKYAAAIRNIPLPDRLARRPISPDNKMPVPWFVSLINGKWDFVNLDPRKIIEAYNRKICWLCGEPMGQFKAFVIGPMCSINRVSSENPAHKECAEYAVRACPFLARPNARRNKAAHATDHMPGVGIQHNPGANLIWITKHYKPMRVHDGVLFEIGDPVEVSWWAEGRPATRDEILAAINKGLPYLKDVAETEGPEAVAEFQQCYRRAMELVPA